jgi:hypothetical protein
MPRLSRQSINVEIRKSLRFSSLHMANPFLQISVNKGETVCVFCCFWGRESGGRTDFKDEIIAI